ncbi:FHA domain-containing protein [Leifsonia sp. NPDC058292]|uniref:FHA domain-containing protein n=1 Tax=Leifsonia sp. NPDC058292 TaxID=3346428 RepID=UPI0036D9CE6B
MFEVQQTASGEWAVVAAENRVLLVERGDGTGRLRSYRSAVRTGFAETLEALAAEGFARTPGFALAEVRGGQVLIAVRGAATAAVTVGDAERAIDAAGVSTWSEQQVAGVSAGRLWVGDSAGASASAVAPLPLADGIVWANAVSWPGEEHEEADLPQALAEKRATAPITAPISVDEVPPAPEPESEATPEPEPIPAAEPAAEPALEPTVAEATIAEPSEATGYDHLFGATMVRSVEDAAVRPDEEDAEVSRRIDIPGFVTDSTPPPASEREGDHDGMTVFSGSLGGLRDRERPGQEFAAADSAASGGQALAVAVAPRFYVDLFDGRREYLEPPIVIGRAPIASTTSRGPAPRPITVTSAEQDISRSHAAIAVEGDSVVVTDLHSRNGTIVVMPGKSPQKLRQGEPTTVIAGTLVDLGSGVTLTVGQDA